MIEEIKNHIVKLEVSISNESIEKLLNIFNKPSHARNVILSKKELKDELSFPYRRWDFLISNNELFVCKGDHENGHKCNHVKLSVKETLDIIERMRNIIIKK